MVCRRQSSVWTAADAVFVRSNSANTTQLRIENSNVGAVMNLSVEGQITSEQGLYNGVNLALLSQEWTAHQERSRIRTRSTCSRRRCSRSMPRRMR